MVSSIAVLLTGFASSTSYMVMLRLVVGLGTGFSNAPGYALTAKYRPKESGGFAVGLFDAFTVLGSLFALVGDSALSLYFGWRLVMMSNGIVGIVFGAVLYLALQEDEGEEGRPNLKIDPRRIRSVLLDRRLLVLGLALLAIQTAGFLCGNFMVYYLEDRFAVTPAAAGAITGLVPFIGLFGALIFGKVSDGRTNIKRLIVSTGILSSAGLMSSAVASVYWATLSNVAVGFWSSAGYVVCLAASRKMQAKRDGDVFETLRTSWLLSLSTIGGLGAPMLFSTLAVESGYQWAWFVSGLLLIPLLLPLIMADIDSESKS